jgi:hypothetical protein
VAKEVIEMTTHLSFRQGVQECIPTLLGYAGVGISFGIVASSQNLVSTIADIGVPAINNAHIINCAAPAYITRHNKIISKILKF